MIDDPAIQGVILVAISTVVASTGVFVLAKRKIKKVISLLQEIDNAIADNHISPQEIRLIMRKIRDLA